MSIRDLNVKNMFSSQIKLLNDKSAVSEAWSTRTYCCQQDGCNSGPSLTASSSTYFVLAISLAVFVMCRSLRG